MGTYDQKYRFKKIIVDLESGSMSTNMGDIINIDTGEVREKEFGSGHQNITDLGATNLQLLFAVAVAHVQKTRPEIDVKLIENFADQFIKVIDDLKKKEEEEKVVEESIDSTNLIADVK